MGVKGVHRGCYSSHRGGVLISYHKAHGVCHKDQSDDDDNR